MEEVKIWAIGDSYAATPLESKSQVETEALLEETLVSNPDLLIQGLKLVGRQTPTEGGPLDLLGVDTDGRLVVFELKRGTLSRDAVAQVVDYASYLDTMELAELAEYISERSGEHGIERVADFQDWYGRQDFGELESLKPLRLFLVGLGTDDRTERMVRFLADNSGMDISLLTFHGFEHDGKTLLAKQVEVEGSADVGPSTAGRRPGAAERRARLDGRLEAFGTSDLFAAVREMFRKNWHGLGENIGPTAIGLRLRQRTETGMRTVSYARIAPQQGKVRIIFYDWAVGLCPGDFDQAKQAIPFETEGWGGKPAVAFPLDPAGWETHKERLYELTQAVYEARERGNQDVGAPDSEHPGMEELSETES